MKVLALLALLAAPLGAQQTQVAPKDPAAQANAVVTRGSKAYQTLSSMRADFKMTTVDPTAGNDDSGGTIYQMGTDKFAMRFSKPANHAYVIDGRYLWTYMPSITPGQVQKKPAPGNSVYGVNFIGAFLDNPIEKYHLIYIKADVVGGRPTDAVELDPNERMEFRRATVWFDREDGLPRKLEFDEGNGVKRTIELSKIQKNITIAPDIFVFTVPKGVKVVSQ